MCVWRGGWALTRCCTLPKGGLRGKSSLDCLPCMCVQLCRLGPQLSSTLSFQPKGSGQISTAVNQQATRSEVHKQSGDTQSSRFQPAFVFTSTFTIVASLIGIATSNAAPAP